MWDRARPPSGPPGAGPAPAPVGRRHPPHHLPTRQASPLTAHHALAYTVSKWGLRGLTKVAALELVVFLLSRRASYITGAEIPVDGGHTSHGGTKSIVDALRHAGR